MDPGDPDVMHRPPRDPSVPISNRASITMWVCYAGVLFLAALLPLVAGPDEPSTEHGTVSMTMAFAVMGIGTVFNALTNRRDPASGLTEPLLKPLAVGAITVLLLFLGTELPRLQQGLLTTSLTGVQWLVCAGLAGLLPLSVELGKVVRRRRGRQEGPVPVVQAVTPLRARGAVSGQAG
jgi:Ca2+-transporting ATPase